jgi:hypothetical protein
MCFNKNHLLTRIEPVKCGLQFSQSKNLRDCQDRFFFQEKKIFTRNDSKVI